MGILLLVAVVIGALIASNLDGKIAGAANDMVSVISGGGKDDGGGGGSGGPGTRARQPGRPGSPGGPGGSGGGPGPGGGPSSEEEAKKTIACLGSAKEAGLCLTALTGPNSVSEKITERARDKVMKPSATSTTRLAPARPSTRRPSPPATRPSRT